MSKNTRTDVALSCLGIYPLESYIDKTKLLFLGQLCRTNPSKRICVLFLQGLTKYLNNPSTTFGFLPDIWKLQFEKNFLHTYASTASFPNRSTWRRNVNKAVHACVENNHASNANGDSKLVL